MRDRTEKELNELQLSGVSISEMIISDHNALDPIRVTPDCKEIGIENFQKIISEKVAKKYTTMIKKFLAQYPEFKERLYNNENFKFLVDRYPEILKELNN